MIDKVEFKGGLEYDVRGRQTLEFKSALQHLNDWIAYKEIQIISICQVGQEDNPTIVLYFKRE